MEMLNFIISNYLNIFIIISFLLVISTTTYFVVNKVTLLHYGDVVNLKKCFSFINDFWIKFVILKIDPNKISFYRGLLNIGLIILVNYIFASEANSIVFAQETNLENKEILQSMSTNSNEIDDRLFSIKHAKKVYMDAKHKADLTLRDIDLYEERRKLPVFPLYPDLDFDDLHDVMLKQEMPFVPVNNVYEGPAKYGYMDHDELGYPMAVRGFADPIELRIALAEDNDPAEQLQEFNPEPWEPLPDDILTFEYVRDELVHDPVYYDLRKKKFTMDFDDYDSYFYRKTMFDFENRISYRYPSLFYNLYWAHPFDMEDYDQLECVENVLDRSELQDSFGIGDTIARYEFFLSLLERGFETEPIPMAEKLKKRPIDSFTSSVPVMTSFIIFALFGGSWYIYDQIYNRDYFCEFRKTTPYFRYYSHIWFGPKQISDQSNQLTPCLRGWNRSETVEWRLYYDETQSMEMRRTRYRRKPGEINLPARMRYLIYKDVKTPEGYPYWLITRGKSRWCSYRGYIYNPHWNYWLEEEPIEYSFNPEHKYAWYHSGFQDENELIKIARVTKSVRAELTAMERWWESTLMPEDWIPARDEFIRRCVTKGGELKEEYDDEIEEFLAEQLEDLYMLRGVGVGLAKHPELWEYYNFENFDFIDLEYLWNMQDVENAL